MGFSLEVFIHMLQFFRRLLITGADPDVIIEESSNEYEIQQFVFTPTTRTRVKQLLQDMWELDSRIDTDPKTLSLYISFLETALNHQGPQGMYHTRLCMHARGPFINSYQLTSLVARRQESSFYGADVSVGVVFPGSKWTFPAICQSTWMVQGAKTFLKQTCHLLIILGLAKITKHLPSHNSHSLVRPSPIQDMQWPTSSVS
jgi:hypothetical protein